MTIYLDTNFFIYLADENSKYHVECKDLIAYCQNNQILLVTSVETIQEIIHFAKNIKQIERGLEIADFTLNIVDQLVPTTPETINLYLKQAEVHLRSSSRDLLHLATCLENNFKIVITFDKDFSKFTNIRAFTPTNFIKYSS